LVLLGIETRKKLACLQSKQLVSLSKDKKGEKDTLFNHRVRQAIYGQYWTTILIFQCCTLFTKIGVIDTN
jgi:hypothetical protein